MKRKKIYLAATIAVAMALAACTDNKKSHRQNAAKDEITVISAAKTVKISIGLAKYDTINIDWGDGSSAKITDDRKTHEIEYLYGDSAAERSIKFTANGISYFMCDNNMASSLDVSKSPDLKFLECDGNLLDVLDLSQNVELRHLSCHHNRLANLDLSKNRALRYLACHVNSLTSLDFSGNPKISIIDCGSNRIKEINISKNKHLERLYCPSNLIEKIDVSKNKRLEDLLCFANSLTSVDISKNRAMKNFDCGSNLITSLDFSKNKHLQYVGCNNNQLSVEALEEMFETLHEKIIPDEEKLIVLTNNPGSADCIRLILIKKKWRAQ
ncbi:MAG: hypothetical protein LBD59_12410 [Prevotellaceae bacterium]|jgi:Leucine-rich repeat (LRR) protein|nr:hypothetical protein [Prevotellaceae bacterium]